MNARRATFIAALLGIIGAAIAWLTARRRRALPGRTLIISPRESTVIAADGSVRSVQAADVLMSAADLERLWNAANLENLARTYWRFLSRATLGLVRVVYGRDERRVVLIIPALTLLRFTAPKYELGADHGRVTWWILDGLLVAPAGRNCGGHLSLLVARQDEESGGIATVRVEVEVANFYPSILSGFSTYVYEATQSVVHVLVTHAFLRSLARLELAESVVGRLADAPRVPAEAPRVPADPR
jgi:hypothetical protein